MVETRVQSCGQCSDITSTISSLDNRIAKIVKNLYSSDTLFAEKRYNSRELKTLVRYKSILSNLYYNGDYYQGVGLNKIISRIKSLT